MSRTVWLTLAIVSALLIAGFSTLSVTREINLGNGWERTMWQSFGARFYTGPEKPGRVARFFEQNPTPTVWVSIRGDWFRFQNDLLHLDGVLEICEVPVALREMVRRDVIALIRKERSCEKARRQVRALSSELVSSIDPHDSSEHWIEQQWADVFPKAWERIKTEQAVPH